MFSKIAQEIDAGVNPVDVAGYGRESTHKGYLAWMLDQRRWPAAPEAMCRLIEAADWGDRATPPANFAEPLRSDYEVRLGKSRVDLYVMGRSEDPRWQAPPAWEHTGFLGASIGTLDATCPHCDTSGPLDRQPMTGLVSGLPVPGGIVLTCQACGGHSAQDPLLNRVLGLILLGGFSLVIGMGFITGVYIGVTSLLDAFNQSFALLGLGLTLFCGFVEFMILRTIRRTWRGGIQPLDGRLQTRIG